MTAGSFSMQLGVWGAKLPPPQLVQGRGLVGVQGAKPLRAPEIWDFKVQNTAQKLNFVVQ